MFPRRPDIPRQAWAIPDSPSPEPPPVALVGAGPGDPALLTLRARALLDQADVVVHDRLVSAAILATVPKAAERVDVGKRPGGVRARQRDIHDLLITKARLGRRVVRLKGGDPFLFGRGSEELDALEAAGLEVEVVPGLTSAFTAPLAARIPVTERGRARDVAVLTVQTRRGLDLEPLRRVAGADTLVLLMGGAQLSAIRAELRRCGRSATTPAAVIERATQDRQRMLRTTLGELPEDVGSAGLRAPMTVVIGDVAAAANRAVPRPLAGRRVVLTQSPGRRAGWARRLRNLGAEVLEMPLSVFRPRTAVDGRGLETLENLQRFDVAVFTSANAVDGFRHLLAARGYDARVLGGMRLAATAEAAGALGRWGLRADRVAPDVGGLELDPGTPTGRVLWPRGESCPVPPGADAPGWRSMVVYDRVAVEPGDVEHGAVERERLEDGVDLVYLDDPASAEAFRRRGLHAPGARFAAGDTTTAEAARAVGLGPVNTVPGDDLRGLRSLLEALPARAIPPESAPWAEALDALAV